jgi:EpsI family protein
MNKIAKRLYVVVAIVLVTYGISRAAKWQTESPPVETPNWSLRDLPLQLGNWRGEAAPMDPQVAVATGADVVVNRIYRDDLGHMVSIHTAMFNDAATGVYHRPVNCYRGAGWKEINEVRENVEVTDDLTIAVSLTTWERENEKILVAYWYQLGKHLLYSRLDLGALRFTAMAGQPTWPVLIKVMVQAPLNDPDDSKTVALAFTQQLAKWLNQPEHLKYLDRWQSLTK